MFRNRAIQMKLVKTDEGELADLSLMPKIELPSSETVKEVSDHVMKNTVIAVVAVIAAAALARTASDIVIHHATK